MTIGFIGQGWIGRHYADDFEARGLPVVRYSLEEPHVRNKDKIAECGIVFIAVPTPTTPEGSDPSAVRAVLPLVAPGAIAVVKSTVLPGTVQMLQEEFPDRIVLHSPEFLREAHAANDAAHPERTLIGLPNDDEAHRKAAAAVLSVLPRAPYERVMSSRATELVKYAGNGFLAMKVVFANLMHDMADALGTDYAEIADALGADPRIGPSHLQVVSASGHTDKAGRGAGGHCFIKDLEALRRLYMATAGDAKGQALLDALALKNNDLLAASGKDLDLLREVYGDRHDLLP